MKYLLLIFILIPYISIAGLRADTIQVKKGENFILLNQDVLECKFSNENFTYESLGNLLKIKMNEEKDGLMLLCCKNNQNSLIYLEKGGSDQFIDARNKLHAYSELNPLERNLSQSFNRQSKYNPRTGTKKLVNVLNENKASSLVSFNKEEGLQLLLLNRDKDYQLKYFAFVLSNKGDDIFIPGLVDIFLENGNDYVEVLPIINTELGCIGGKNEKKFAFAISKKMEGNLTVRIKDKYDHNRTIKLLIPNI